MIQSAQTAEIKENQPKPRAVFDADRLQVELERDLPKSLRDLADAIEAGQMSGKMVGFTPWGFDVDCRDDRIHLLVKLHLAAEIRKSIEVIQK